MDKNIRVYSIFPIQILAKGLARLWIEMDSIYLILMKKQTD